MQMKNPIINRIEEQINKIFGSLNSCYSTKVSFILKHLDLSLINIQQRESKFSVSSMIKLYLYRRVKGFIHYTKLIDHLEDDNGSAYGLGFYQENNKLVLPTKRTFNKFFKSKVKRETILFLENISECILKIATSNKVLLDIELVKKTVKDFKNKVKERNKAFKEAVKLVKKLVYPQIKIKLRHNAKFTTRDLLDVLVHVAQTHDFCNNGVKTFRELNPDVDIPARETILYHLRKLNKKEEIEETFRNIFDVIFEFSKRNYNLLNRRKLDIAIDVHDIPYYGDKND